MYKMSESKYFIPTQEKNENKEKNLCGEEVWARLHKNLSAFCFTGVFLLMIVTKSTNSKNVENKNERSHLNHMIGCVKSDGILEYSLTYLSYKSAQIYSFKKKKKPWLKWVISNW